jgi:hypothetical protein
LGAILWGGHAQAWARSGFDEVQACFEQRALAAFLRGQFRQRRAMDGRDLRPAMTAGFGFREGGLKGRMG